MAVCKWCEEEMTAGGSCSVAELHRQGERVAMVRFGDERAEMGTPSCGDCGVRRGGLHHLGCDLQRCPVCRCQMMSCGCRFDEDGPAIEELEVDRNGDPVEVIEVGGRKVVVHYRDIPDEDLTVVDGIPCTTALRTMIDVAVDTERLEFEGMVGSCLARGLFTADEARVRLSAHDMRTHPGALLLRAAIAQMS